MSEKTHSLARASCRGDRTRRRVLIPAPSPESRPEQPLRARHLNATRNQLFQSHRHEQYTPDFLNT